MAIMSGWCDCNAKCLGKWAMSNLLLLLTLVGVLAGILIVVILRPHNPSDDVVMWIGMPGELFLRGLELTIIPLLASTVITAVASLELKENGRMAGVAFIFFISTTMMGVITGIFVTALIRPGQRPTFDDHDESAAEIMHYKTQDVFADLLRNLIPSNIIRACFQSSFTKYDVQVVTTDNTTTTVTNKQIAMTNRTNIMGVVIFCIACGMAMSVERVKTKPLLDFMWAVRTVIFQIFGAFIWSLPVATASLIAASLLKVEDMFLVEQELGMFVATVIVVLSIHFCANIPTLYFLMTRKNAFSVYMAVNKAIITAMVIKSGAGALPLMMKSCESPPTKMHRNVSSFVLPLCICFKGDASASFIMCSVLWLGQRAGVFMTLAQHVALGIMATFLCLCIPPIPSASIVIIVLICNSLGIPPHDIGLLLALEWLNDSLRTGVNNGSHAVCAAAVNNTMKKRFAEKDLLELSHKKSMHNNHDDMSGVVVHTPEFSDGETEHKSLMSAQY